MKKLLMISGDRALAEGKHGAFYNTLEEFHKHWDRIDIITPKISNSKIKITNVFGNVFIHSSPWPLIFQPFWIYREGLRILKTNSYSLMANNYLMTVHDFPPFYNGIGARLIWHATHVPYILEIHHIVGFPKAAGFKEKTYCLLSRWFLAWDARHARAVRVVNNNQTPLFLKQSGVPSWKIQYIPSAYIDDNIFYPQPDIIKEYDLVFASRLESNKNIFNLIKAVEIIKETKPNISLLIIGSGPLKGELERYVSFHNLSNNITFSGWLESSLDVARAYQRAHIFVNPSLNEGGPRVALEAMACGVPVVTTRVGLMLDIIRDGEGGLFCGWSPESMASVILKILDNLILQQKCSQNGLVSVRQFEKKRAIAQYANAIKEVSRKRLLVITQKVDCHDQLLGFFIEWLKRFARKMPTTVLCLENRETNLPASIMVASLGKDNRQSKLRQLFNFYNYIWNHEAEYDTVFVHMSPIWVVLGGWYWRLADKKIILWYTSGGITTKLKIAALFAHTILTASKESFRLSSRKIVVTGHGIDTDFFNSRIGHSRSGILTIGRISPVKNYDVLVRAAKILKDSGLDFKIAIAGEPALRPDEIYLDNLKEQIRRDGLESIVRFLGRIDYERLPELYNEYNLFVHMSRTGSLDKALLEAMACGLNVLSSNDAARAFLDDDHLFSMDDASELAEKIKILYKTPGDKLLRDFVVKHHNLDVLIDKIVQIAEN